jgi:hypothetical protein
MIARFAAIGLFYNHSKLRPTRIWPPAGFAKHTQRRAENFLLVVDRQKCLNFSAKKARMPDNYATIQSTCTTIQSR